MRSTFFNKAAIEFEYQKSSHQYYVREKIKSFNKSLKKLQASNATIGFSIGVSLLTAMTGGIALPYIGLLFLEKAYSENEKHAARTEIYQNKLAELFAIYKWCIRTGTPTTYDPVIIELLETIAPYINDPKNLLPENCSSVSPGFAKILKRPPHELVLTEATSVEQNTAELNSSIYGQITAEVCRRIYGMEEQKEKRVMSLGP